VVEIVKGKSGAPQLKLHGKAQALAHQRGWREWSVSLSHTHEHAIAMVVAND